MPARVPVSPLTGRSHLDHWAICRVPIVKGGYMPNPRQLPVAPGTIVPWDRVQQESKTAFRKPPFDGCVIYEGPSLLTGEPIVAIATGFREASANRKTGAIIQTFILRADMPPQEAIDTGADTAICGTCPARGEGLIELAKPRPRAYRRRGTGWQRGTGVGKASVVPKGRACYVVVAQAPNAVWWKYYNGGYPRVTLSELAYYTWGRDVRLGTYGDPAAVPAEVWLAVFESANYVLAYTHQWRLPVAQPLKAFMMASTNNEEELREAIAMGWRSFRAMKEGEQLVPGLEVVCPASDEAEAKKGKKAKCVECKSCQGLAAKTRRSVAIREHGYLIDPGGRKKKGQQNPGRHLVGQGGRLLASEWAKYPRTASGELAWESMSRAQWDALDRTHRRDGRKLLKCDECGAGFAVPTGDEWEFPLCGPCFDRDVARVADLHFMPPEVTKRDMQRWTKADPWERYLMVKRGEARLKRQLRAGPRSNPDELLGDAGRRNPWIPDAAGIPSPVPAWLELATADGVPYWRHQASEAMDDDMLVQTPEEIGMALEDMLHLQVSARAHGGDPDMPDPQPGDVATLVVGPVRQTGTVVVERPGAVRIAWHS